MTKNNAQQPLSPIVAFALALVLASLASASDATYRVANWNIFNRPNSTQDFDDTRTILEAIGTESFNGLVDGIDILALQETDTGSTQSQQKVEQILNQIGDGFFDSIFSPASGGGDRTSIYYDTTELSLVGSSFITSTNPSTRAQFRPVGTDGSYDFYVYSVHLTSGGGPGGRTSEMAALRDDADALGPDAEILWIGDFNLEGSFEGAWQEIYAPGDARGRDVADSPGNYSDNGAFLDLHTQDPRGQLDDRFDFQFGTTEVFDDLGLSYIEDSYRVFGNNGTHLLNGSILTGSGASAGVLAALGGGVSDHLPVVADYSLVFEIPEPTGLAVFTLLGISLVVRGRIRFESF